MTMEAHVWIRGIESRHKLLSWPKLLSWQTQTPADLTQLGPGPWQAKGRVRYRPAGTRTLLA